MHELGKVMVIVGTIVGLLGGILWRTGGLGGLGQLPGDFWWRKGNLTVGFPIVTCLLLSLFLALLSWLFRR